MLLLPVQSGDILGQVIFSGVNATFLHKQFLPVYVQ